MNKRSAMLVAAGLVAALLAGVAAVRMSVGGGIPASAANEKVKPIVHTIERTITVHKKAKHSSQPALVVLPARGSASTSLSASSFEDDGFESEGFDAGSSGDD
jgi:hypothetical protein